VRVRLRRSVESVSEAEAPTATKRAKNTANLDTSATRFGNFSFYNIIETWQLR
jgi:hypothetical protein